MSTAARVTLVRHGESLSNRGRRLSGQHDVPLTERGHAQAEALASRLGHVHFDRVVSSDLARARSTADALARPFALEPGFREIDLGGWQGLTPSEVEARFADQLARLEAGEDEAIGGGESYRAFCARVDRALAQLVDTLASGDHALVVCHGAVIGALVSGALGLRDEAVLPIGVPMHTSLTTLSFERSECPTLSAFNDASHLGPAATPSLALVAAPGLLPCHGSFAAVYDGAREAASAADFAALLARLRGRHPDERIALCAAPAVIRRWVEGVLWPGAHPAAPTALREPPEGAIAHVGEIEGRPALLDYGVLR